MAPIEALRTASSLEITKHVDSSLHEAYRGCGAYGG